MLKYLVLLALLFPVSALAQDIEEMVDDTSVTYAPDFCDFSITFPEAPYKSRRCKDEERKECFELTSYTQVYDMTSTVNFRVVCNPINEDVYENYSPEVMATTLRALTKNSVVEEFDSSFREEDEYKQAGIVGEGQVGRTPAIYLAQLWIGKHSAFSLEAELIGNAVGSADKLFSDILRTVGPKEEMEKARKAAKKAAEKAAKNDAEDSTEVEQTASDEN